MPGGHTIQTKFFVLGLPILPLDSYYVLSEKSGFFFGGSINGFRIPMHGRSVLLGYLHGPAIIVGLIGLVMMCAGDGVLQRGFGLLVVGGLVALAVLVRSEDRATTHRRQVLFRGMGIGADPEWLQNDGLERIYTHLRARAGGAETYDDACVAYAMMACGAELKRRAGDAATAAEWSQKGRSLLDSLASGG